MCHRRAALSFSSLFQSLKDRFLFAPRLFFRKASAKLQPFFQPAKLYGNFFTFSSDFFARKGKKGKTGGRIGRFVMEKARPEGTKGRALGTWPSRPRLSIGRFLAEKVRPEGKGEGGKNVSRTEGKQMSRRRQQFIHTGDG